MYFDPPKSSKYPRNFDFGKSAHYNGPLYIEGTLSSIDLVRRLDIKLRFQTGFHAAKLTQDLPFV